MSYHELAAELVWEVAQCSRFKESKAYLAAILKILLALPLGPTQHPAAIKTLRALVGRLPTIFIALQQLIPSPTCANQFAVGPAAKSRVDKRTLIQVPAPLQCTSFHF